MLNRVNSANSVLPNVAAPIASNSASPCGPAVGDSFCRSSPSTEAPAQSSTTHSTEILSPTTKVLLLESSLVILSVIAMPFVWLYDAGSYLAGKLRGQA